MLQCPNCKEYCITYWDTFGAKFNSPEVCRKCDELFKVSNIDIFKRLFLPLIGMSLVIYLRFEYLKEISVLFFIILIAITFFLIDYLLYTKSLPLKKVVTNTKELGIIKVDRNEFYNLLEKLSKAKKNSFITILENENYERYLEISYEENKYILTLSLISKNNRELEDKFSSVSESLGFLVSKKTMNKVDFLEISISEDKKETITKVEDFIKRIFNQKEVLYFTLLPDGM
jgi:hypothetical protein